MTQMYEDNLPSKASELIRLALSDLRKVEAADNVYVVDMGQWHEPGGVGDSRCAVCLAGAVVAQSLGLDPGERFVDHVKGMPHSIDEKTSALNEFRKGEVDNGMYYLLGGDDYELNEELFQGMFRHVPHYTDHTKEEFHAAMEKLAADLAALGY